MNLNFSLLPNKNTTQLGQFEDNDASKAIDGIQNYEIDSCHCCSVSHDTSGKSRTWWQIDLGKQYLIDSLSLYGRSDGKDPKQIQGAEVFAGNNSLSDDNRGLKIIDVTSVDVYHLKSSIIARYIIVRNKYYILTLCEFLLSTKNCPAGSYGNGCLHACHCRGDKACDPVTGHCDAGQCDPHYNLDECYKYDNVVQRLNASVEQSNSWTQCVANRAIDGNDVPIDTSDNALCQACSVAQNTSTQNQNAWLILDLGKLVLIEHIRIIGRSGTHIKQSQNLVLTFSTMNLKSTSNGENISSNSATGHSFNIDLSPPRLFQYLKFEKPEPMTLCEVKLLEGECEIGKFGDGCQSRCHCFNKTSCNNVNGTCTEGRCDPGWLRHNCSVPCEQTSFGEDCKVTCHCINKTSCDNVNGTCTMGQCDPGWFGHNCIIPCEHVSFGNGCKYTCHCINKTSCDNVDGTCKVGQCDPGWLGQNCSIQKLKIPDEDSPNTHAIVGGTFAVIIVVAIVVLVGFFLYRRQKSRSTNQDSANEFSHLNEALRQKQQRREESSQSSRRVAENVNAAYIETKAEGKMDNKRDTGVEDNGGDYYDDGVVGIKIHELWDYIHEKTKNDCEQLYVEFQTLPSGLIHPCASAVHIANREKNRYKEMYAYDHTRVVLEEKNDKGTDYVNANYIDGYKETRRFVACQGPTKQMIEDFWRMVWQLKSDKIVMLTNLIEQGATKCVLYWPKDEEFSYGKINVKIVKLETDLDFDIRHFNVWKEGESPRRILQYHFKSWPDKDVPDSTWCLLKFWRAVKTDAESMAGPIVVHCSAGVGRTGTFIALDNLIHQARDEGCVRPLQIVQALRGQRVNMVQSQEQYVYLHEVLADALCFGTHFVWRTQFEPMYMSLLQKEDGGVKARLEVQYDLIQKSLEDTESKEAAEAPEYSNMEMITSESDAYRPKLKKRGSKFVQQLGATFIPNYDGRNTFLVAMSPDKSTIEEFWSLVDDLNIKTVIMLTEKSSTCYKTSCDLGAQNDNKSKFHVNKLEEKIKKSYTERSFTFKESQGEEDNHLVSVKQFEYTTWKAGYEVPGDAHSLMDFLEEILKWQPHISESQPVLIYDSDGFSRSGILCVALNEMQRINKEGGHINIVQSVKTMKQRKSQIIHNYEQYKFCYDLILAHLKHTELYQNLKSNLT